MNLPYPPNDAGIPRPTRPLMRSAAIFHLTLFSGRHSIPAMSRQMETFTKRLVTAALMLPIPNTYAETQAASNMITAAAAISLYKIHCRGEIPAAAVETVNTTIRMYGESRVVASMAEIGLQREKLGHRAFCAHVEKDYLKK
jgi:hypothetical protein